MKVVILSGASSSSAYVAAQQFEGHDYYMGGEEMRQQIQDADLIFAVWPPDDEPIILKAPEGVEVVGVRFPWNEKPTLHASITEDEFARRTGSH